MGYVEVHRGCVSVPNTYVFGAEMGQCDGGLNIYFLDGGKFDCTKACLKSQDFGVIPFFTASATSSLSSICDRTGANVSCLSQLWGSRLPRATILYFARCGDPCSSCFIVDTAIDGNMGPRMCLSCWYSVSVMISKHPSSSKPLYSSL